MIALSLNKSRAYNVSVIFVTILVLGQARPKGATQSIQYCVMGLDKGVTIACDPSLVLNALGYSVLIKPTLLEY
jgi:hypothetical protein